MASGEKGLTGAHARDVLLKDGKVEYCVFIVDDPRADMVMLRAYAAAWNEEGEFLQTIRPLTAAQLALARFNLIEFELQVIEQQFEQTLGLPVIRVWLHDHRGRPEPIPTGYYTGFTKEQWQEHFHTCPYCKGTGERP